MALTPVSRARLQASAACAGSLLVWAWRGGRPAGGFALAAGLLALVSWFRPAWAAPVHRGLERLLQAFLAGLTWLLLGLIYLGVFTPLRAWRTLRRTDPLQRGPDPGATTYLRPLPPATPGRFDRQF